MLLGGTSTRPQLTVPAGDCAWVRRPGQLRGSRAAGIAAVCGRDGLLVFVMVFAGDTHSDDLEPMAQCRGALPTTSAPKTRSTSSSPSASAGYSTAALPYLPGVGPARNGAQPAIQPAPPDEHTARSSSTAPGLSRASRVNPAGHVEGHPNDPHRKRARGRI